MPIDNKSFGVGQPPDQAFPSNIGRRWWEMEDQLEIAQSISANLRLMQESGKPRISQYVRSTRLYGNVSLIGYMGITSTKFANAMNLLPDRLTYNLSQSCVDSATSKIGKNKPKPLYLTKGGDFGAQRKAKKLTQFMEGVFYENRAHVEGPMVFRDGAVVGDGLTKVYIEDGRVKYSRTLATELWVDEMEGFYGQPRQMHQVKPVDRSVIIACVKSWAKAGKLTQKRAAELEVILKEIPQAKNEETNAKDKVADMIEVRESWHLPSSKDAGDGKHVITVAGNCLIDPEDWPHDFFPFARFRYCPRMYGFWSQGGVEQIQGTQIELNTQLWTLQRSLRLGGTFKVMIPIGSKIVREHINNELGTLIYYSGDRPPVYAVPPLVQPEIYQHIQLLINRGYDQFGISQLSATSEKPAGLNAAVALREYNDIESDRFRTIGERYEDYFMQLSKISIEMIRTAAKDGVDYAVNVRRGRSSSFLSQMKWSEISLNDDDFQMQCFPVSSLPNDPAGRFEQVQEWVQAGWYSVAQGKRLMNFPDTEAVDSLWNAMEDRLEQILDGIVDDGKYVPPEPYYDLSRAAELATQYLVHGETQALDLKRQLLLRRWISQVQALQQMAQQAAQAQALQQQAMQAQAQNPPQPAQQNELVPNVGPAAA